MQKLFQDECLFHLCYKSQKLFNKLEEKIFPCLQKLGLERTRMGHLYISQILVY